MRVISATRIDRHGLHRLNLAGLRSALHALSPPAEICLVDGFRLGPPPRARAVVDGDERERGDRRGFDHGQGRPRPRDAADGRAVSRGTASPRTSATSPRPFGEGAAARAVRHPPPLVPGALLPLRGRSPGPRGASHLVAGSGGRAPRRLALPVARLPDPGGRTCGPDGARSTSSSAAARGSSSARSRCAHAWTTAIRCEMVGADRRTASPRRVALAGGASRTGRPAELLRHHRRSTAGRSSDSSSAFQSRVGTDTCGFAVYGRGVLGRATTHALVGLEPRRVEVEAHLAARQAGVDDRRSRRPRLPGGEGTRPQRDRVRRAGMAGPARSPSISRLPRCARRDRPSTSQSRSPSWLPRGQVRSGIAARARSRRRARARRSAAARRRRARRGRGSASEPGSNGSSVPPNRRRRPRWPVWSRFPSGTSRRPSRTCAASSRPPPYVPPNGRALGPAPRTSPMFAARNGRARARDCCRGAPQPAARGPPGTGKTMVARRLPGILPPLGRSQALEVTRIHSVAGVLGRTGR